MNKLNRSYEIIHSSAYFKRIETMIRYMALFVPLFVLPLGLGYKLGYIEGKPYAGDIWLYGLSLAFLVNGVTQFIVLARWATPVTQFIFLSVMHALISIAILKFTHLYNPVIFFWFALLIGAAHKFGMAGYFMSICVLVLLYVISLFFDPNLTIQQIITMTTNVSMVMAIGYGVAKIFDINNEERLELFRTHKKEEFQSDRLLALVNSMGDAVMTTDESGKIKVYNAATLSLLDTNKELHGLNIEQVLNLHDQKGRKVHIIEEVKKDDRIYSRTDLAHKFTDKEVARLYINVAPIRSKSNRDTGQGFIFILRDITKEKTLEEERDEFISVVSHELRTPVAIAEGNLSNLALMEKNNSDSKLKLDSIQSAHDQIIYLAQLVNDLATLSRAEKSADTEFEEVDIKSFMEHLYSSYESQAKQKNLQLNLWIDPNCGSINTNRLYLQEILQNFLTNALRYTKEGSITLKAACVAEGVEFSVSDTGIGISISDQKRIFEKFYRSEDYRTRETPGTGLGLYVCKKLSHKLGFQIQFESRLNHGSKFFFVLPVSDKSHIKPKS